MSLALFDVFVFCLCSPGVVDFLAEDHQFAADGEDEDEPYDAPGETGFLKSLGREPGDRMRHMEEDRELDEVDVDVDVDNDSESFEEEGPEQDI